MANSSHVIGEPFGAMPLLQSRNRFVPLPHQVSQIETYAQCVNMLDDAAYFAHGQAVARGNDPLRAQYANYFHNFAHGQPSLFAYDSRQGAAAAANNENLPSSTISPMSSSITIYEDGTVLRKSNEPVAIGACSLLKTKSSKKYAWPVAKEQLQKAVASFHSGRPLSLPPVTYIPAITCTSSYTNNRSSNSISSASGSIAPWICEM